MTYRNRNYDFQNYDILQVLDFFNVSYNKKNDSKCLEKCCFHEDNKPSLTIYTKTNTFKCFACQIQGNIPTFIMNYRNIEFVPALQIFEEIFNLDTNTQQKSNFVPLPKPKIAPAPEKLKVDFDYLYRDILEFCSMPKNANRLAIDYLLNERMLQPEILKQAKIKTFNSVLLENYLRAKYSKEILQGAGLVSEKNWFYAKNYSILIPYFAGGKIDTLQFRTLYPNEFNSKYIFLKGRNTTNPFNVDRLQSLNNCNIAITEGVFDSLIAMQVSRFLPAHEKYAGAIAFQSAGVTENQLKTLFSTCKANNLNVEIYLDNDKLAKVTNKENASEILQKKIEVVCNELAFFTINFIDLNEFKDLNELYINLKNNALKQAKNGKIPIVPAPEVIAPEVIAPTLHQLCTNIETPAPKRDFLSFAKSLHYKISLPNVSYAKNWNEKIICPF